MANKNKSSKNKENEEPVVDIFTGFANPSLREYTMHFAKSRLASFKDWPFDDDSSCTPTTLSDAGFYHIPTSEAPDAVRCFVCYKELDGWEPDDSPRSEHQKHSPHCAFLKVKKPIMKLTMEEFLELECERQKNKLRKFYHAKKQMAVDQGKLVRKELEKLNKK